MTHRQEMTEQSSNPRFQPLKASIEAEVTGWLKQPGPEDTVLVYFSGHGFRDAAGKMYLAPIDCNPDDLVRTGISVEWFRQQLAACKAHFKLLMLDACHAGSEKGPDDKQSVTSKDLGEPFKDLEGVVTLASSTAKEKSQIWEEKQQSLFSYWVNQAMRGHADENNVGVLEFTNDTKVGELLGADFGLLGRYCAEELERRLVDQGQNKFSVVDRRRLQAALQEQGFKLSDLGSANALKDLSNRTGGMPIITLGHAAKPRGAGDQRAVQAGRHRQRRPKGFCRT